MYFGHFSLLAPLSSALITSLFSLLSLFGIGAIALCWFKPAQDVAFCLVDFLGQFIETLTSFLSERSFASVSLTDVSWIVSLLVFAAMVALYVFWPKREKSSFIWHLFDGVYAYFGFKYLLEVFLANKNLCDGYWPR